MAKESIKDLYKALLPALAIGAAIVLGRPCTQDELEVAEEIGDILPGGQDGTTATTAPTSTTGE